MTKLKHDLLEAIADWRKMSAEAELASKEVGKLFAQGYLRGIALSCENAAKRIEAIINANTPQVVRRVKHVARKAPHFKKPLK